MKRKSSFNLNIGASSILVIVVILCLVCFAGLSVASANADFQLSNKLSDRTTSYYNAVSEAYINLYNTKKESSSQDSFEKMFSVNDNQALYLKADINPSDNSNYEIITFKLVTINEPTLDKSLSLLLGN